MALRFLLGSIWIVLVTGCGSRSLLLAEAAVPTPTTVGTATVESTATALPANTPTLTATPLPTATPTATRTPTVTHTPTATSSPTSTPRPSPVPTFEVVPGEIGQHAYTVTLAISSRSNITRLAQVNYLLYLPQNYQAGGKPWPLIVFLHGSGERGYNANQIASTGLPQRLENQSDFPFIVLSPQVPTDQWWEDQLTVLPVLIAQIETHYAIDVKREYLTGLSMGGFGAWALAMRYPQKFAAVAPIAGGWNGSDMPRDMCVVKDVPFWVFHGALDQNVFPQQTERMVEALQQCGGNVRFTLYPDADHDGSWQRAYADPELYQWLLSQHLP
ncbi:MAG: prolyl oligopeptidase family serine peptidase [Anaerolineae bacterium]